MRPYCSIFLFLSFFLASCSGNDRAAAVNPSFETAVEYNEFIIRRQEKIVAQIMYVAEMIGNDPGPAQAALREGVGITDSALADLDKLGPFKGDTVFRGAARASFRFYRRLFSREYPKVLRTPHGSDSLQQNTYVALQALRQSLESEERELDKKLGRAQSDFAKKNNMPLLQNGVQER